MRETFALNPQSTAWSAAARLILPWDGDANRFEPVTIAHGCEAGFRLS